MGVWDPTDRLGHAAFRLETSDAGSSNTERPTPNADESHHRLSCLAASQKPVGLPSTLKIVALYLAVVGGSWVATRLPLRASYGLAWAAGTLSFMLSRGARRAVIDNLAVVLELPPSSSRVRRTALAAFRNNARNWIDSLRLGVTSRDEIERRVHVEGWDVLESALEEGKGAVMIGAHLGNIDLVGQIMAARGLLVTIPVEPVRPEALFQRTQRLRQSMGIQAIPAENSARRLLRSLKAGGVVGIMADRNLMKEGLEVEFFGRPTVVSAGPAWLATRSSSPVMVGTGTRLTGGSFAGRVTRLGVQRTGDHQADQQANARLIMGAIEERIRGAPDQWCMFAPVWHSGARG